MGAEKPFVILKWKWKALSGDFSVAPWLRGSVAPWLRGSVAPWLRGSVAPWLRGSVAPWLRGSVAPWLRGSVAPWLRGSVAPWLRGSVAPWLKSRPLIRSLSHTPDRCQEKVFSFFVAESGALRHFRDSTAFFLPSYGSGENPKNPHPLFSPPRSRPRKIVFWRIRGESGISGDGEERKSNSFRLGYAKLYSHGFRTKTSVQGFGTNRASMGFSRLGGGLLS